MSKLSRPSIPAIPTRKDSLFYSLLIWAARLCLRFPLLWRLRPMAWRVRSLALPAAQLSGYFEPNQSAAAVGDSITIVTANLWHDWPRHRAIEARLEAFAGLIESESADIVLVQEVARTADLRVDEWLKKRLGMAFVYARANGHQQAIGFEEGLAVLSRFPIRAPRIRQLGKQRNPFVRRLALGASIETPFGQILVFSVHLGLARRQNARQIAHLRTWVSELAGHGAALVGGDFNAPENASQLLKTRYAWLDIFRILNPGQAGATHALRSPWGTVLRRQRLDYLFLKPGTQRWSLLESRLLDVPGTYLSDHQPVLARLAPLK